MIGDFWIWLIGGTVLIAAEIMLPGTFLVWPGIAAFLTGMVAYMVPDWGWQVHAGLFAVLTVASAVAGRRLYARFSQNSAPAERLNCRAQQLIGSRHTLDTPILDGYGRMRVGDTTWKVAGPDLPVGTHVHVVAVDGIVLTVAAD